MGDESSAGDKVALSKGQIYYQLNKERIRAAGARWRAKNAERMAAIRLAWALAHKEEIKAHRAARRSSPECKAYHKQYRVLNKDRIKQLNAAGYQRNKAKRKVVADAWRKANAEKVKLNGALWRKANPDIVKAMRARRRATMRGGNGTFCATDIKRILADQRGKCAHPWCRKKLSGGYDIDHITPLSKGGTNWPKNLQLLCASCNRKKHAKDPIAFSQENGLLL